MTEDELMRKYAEAHGCREIRIPNLTDEQLKKWRIMKESEAAHIHIETDSHVLPLPCRRDEKGNTKYQSVKVLFSKIDEELNELKESVLGYHGAQIKLDGMAEHESRLIGTGEREMIAEEAADTITAITTLLEALGIDEEMRIHAQERVNFKNGQRGRL